VDVMDRVDLVDRDRRASASTTRSIGAPVAHTADTPIRLT
jgi:hypothetical protein